MGKNNSNSKKDWSCIDGYWTNTVTGEVSEYACEGGDESSSDLDRTCINFDEYRRCWLTLVPLSILDSKKKPIAHSIPLVIDMHGGGGYAEGQVGFSGYDTLAELREFIVVYPQGKNNLWASCGTDQDKCQSEKGN